MTFDFNKEHFECTLSVFDRMRNTFISKNHDYGGSFAKSFEKRGIISALIRMEDKWNRLEELAANGSAAKVVDESIIDTLLDLANYSAMTAAALMVDANHKQG